MLTIFIRLICVLSWTTVVFVPKREVRRFIPVTMLSGLFTVTLVLIGSQYNFWGSIGKSKKALWNHLLLVLGPFAIANLWIFHLTYGKFAQYMITNLLNNLLYSFSIIPLIEKANYLSYVKFTRLHHFLVTTVEALLLYAFQMVYEKPFSKIRL